MLADLGFEDVALHERFDVFRGTQVAAGVSPKVGPHGVNVYARAP